MASDGDCEVNIDHDNYVAGWYPQFGVRLRSDSPDNSNSAIVPFQAQPKSYTEDHVCALQDENTALKEALNEARDVNAYYVAKYEASGFDNPKVIAMAAAIASFGIPDPTTLIGLNVKAMRAKLRQLLAQNGGAEMQAHQWELKIDNLKATYNEYNINVESVKSTKNTFEPGSTMNNNTFNQYYQAPPLAQGPPKRRRKDPKFPKYRTKCDNDYICRSKNCALTHTYQRNFYGRAIDNLKDFVTKDNCGLPENGGI